MSKQDQLSGAEGMTSRLENLSQQELSHGLSFDQRELIENGLLQLPGFRKLTKSDMDGFLGSLAKDGKLIPFLQDLKQQYGSTENESAVALFSQVE